MRVLVTGSSGLVGSEAVTYFARLGAAVHGFDNNMRREFFGAAGDTTWVLERLRARTPQFRHHEVDVRDRAAVERFFEEVAVDLVVHCAAQPSHDLARERPLVDFEVNATGTLNLLEATRRFRPEAVFCFMSTNKVYGDAPNRIPLVEQPTRWDYARPDDREGVSESCSVDQCQHSVFGCSKLAADVLCQEYAHAYGLKTGVFRGGCLTGSSHSGVELHGFLSYLVRAARDRKLYRIYGYKGKQVRDQLHAFDVARAFHEFFKAPRPGEVYNLGGGRPNSASVLECIDALHQLTGFKLETEYVDEARKGDHICYVSDTSKLRAHFPGWRVTRDLSAIWQDLLRSRND